MLPPWHSDPAVHRYKVLLKSKRSGFFDVEEFQLILDHFIYLLDLPEASEALEKALSQHPGSQSLMLRKADLALLNGRAEECLRILNQLQVVNPSDADILRLKAEALAAIGQFDRAIQVFENLADQGDDIDSLAIQMRLAQLKDENKGPLESIPHWQETISLEPTFNLAYTELETCYLNADLLEEGSRYFQSLIDEDAYNALAWSSLGACARLDDRYDEAVEAFDYAMIIADTRGSDKVQLAFCYYQLDKYEESLRLYAELHEEEPDDSSHLCCMGECLEQMGHLDLAEKKYNACLIMDPEYADARLGMAIIRDLQGEDLKAVRFIETAVGLEPENPDYWLVFARLLSKTGQMDRCKMAFERALQLNPEDLESTLLFMDHLADREEYDSVLEKVQHALQGIGNVSELYIRAIRALHASSRKEECNTLLELMVETHEGSLELLREYFPQMFEDAEVLSLIKNL